MVLAGWKVPDVVVARQGMHSMVLARQMVVSTVLAWLISSEGSAYMASERTEHTSSISTCKAGSLVALWLLGEGQCMCMCS